MVGGQRFGIFHVREVQAVPQLDHRADHTLLLSGRRPRQGAFGGVLPEVDAVAQPVVIVLDALPVKNPGPARQNGFREVGVASMITDEQRGRTCPMEHLPGGSLAKRA